MANGEEQETYELIVRVFHKYVAPVYSENGIAIFLSMLSPEGLSEMKNGKNSFVILAKLQVDLLLGVSLLTPILCAESTIENLNMAVSNSLDLILVMGNHNQCTL